MIDEERMDKECDEADVLKMIIDRLNADEKDRKNRMKGWVDAEFCTPDNEEEVLVCVSRTAAGVLIGRRLEFASYQNGEWVNADSRETENTSNKVTHWMPLDKLMPEV